jgi:hypothetical protein
VVAQRRGQQRKGLLARIRGSHGGWELAPVLSSRNAGLPLHAKGVLAREISALAAPGRMSRLHSGDHGLSHGDYRCVPTDGIPTSSIAEPSRRARPSAAKDQPGAI